MPTPHPNSESLFLRARQLLPGGVSSPVRAFKGVGGNPLFIKQAAGAIITDADANPYIDYVGSYGPMIVGHANEQVVAALSKALGRGTSFGAPTESEIHLASRIVDAFPSIEMVRFVNSGTEATMSAIRLARAATGRDLIAKCVGGYHGHSDSLLVSAGSGALTLGTPSSPGVPTSVAASTLLVHFNDLAQTAQIFEQFPGQIAALLIEPVAGNMGCVPPAPGYLAGLRNLCTQHGILLILDEVMTGFRVAYGGAQTLYNLHPDLTTLGKIIGGGLPVGAYAGPKKLMELISPAGPVYQAGTLSGNPLAMAAGIATLDILKDPGCYDFLESQSAKLAAGLEQAASAAKVPLTLNRVGSMLTPFFTPHPVSDFASATSSDTTKFATFFHAMLDQGVYLPPSQYEAWFISLAHTDDLINQTIEAAQHAFEAVAGKD